MKKLFESLFYLFLAALCVVGIGLGIEHINDKEDDVVETLPEESDVLELTISSENGNKTYVIQYEDGMTWKDWIESDYCSNSSIDVSTNDEDECISFDDYVLTYGFDEAYDDYSYVSIDDLISNDKTIFLMSNA